MPTFLGQETKKQLLGLQYIVVNELEWEVRYDHKLEIIYGLKNLINIFRLSQNDSIWFSVDVNDELKGRFFLSCAMEITFSKAESSSRRLESDHCFIFEDVAPVTGAEMCISFHLFCILLVSRLLLHKQES